MSKTNQKGWEERTSESVRNLLNKPITLKSSCSLNIVGSKLPSIDDTTPKKKGVKPRVCKKVSSGDSTAKFWLKHGLSLPKMHEMEKADVLKRTPPSTQSSSTISSAQSLKLDLPQPVASPEPSVTTPGGCFLRIRAKSEDTPGKVTGPSLCQSSFEVAYSDRSDNIVKLEDGYGDGSAALKNWEKWMKIRRRQNDRFAEKLKRDKCQLVTNTGDNVREIWEEQDLLTRALLLDLHKWRESQKWREPLKFPLKGLKDKYDIHQTMLESGFVPPFETITVPDAVKKEKDVPCPQYATENKAEYRKMREKQYSKQMNFILPHKADARGLIVIGKKISQEEEKESPKQWNPPEIMVTPAENCQESEGFDGKATFGIISLIINGVNLYAREYNSWSGDNKTIREGHTWSLIFEEAPVGTITSQTLVVENRGTVAVRYKWTKRKPETLPSSFPPRKTSSSGPYFFFNKNPGVFLPGQKIEIVFHHLSKTPGYRSESWCLDFNPCVLAEGSSAIVRLAAVASAKATMNNVLKMDAYLNSCTAETIARDILWEIFERSKTIFQEDIEYQSLFMEDELFEFQNKSYYYRFDTLEELKSLFKQIPMQQSRQWDFNLFTLEHLIREFMPPKEQRDMICKLMELSRSLLRPRPSLCREDNKYKMLYNALCSVMDTIEENAIRIRDVIIGMDQPELNTTELTEEQLPRQDSVRSGLLSSYISLEHPDPVGSDNHSASDNSLFKVPSKDVTHYQYVLHLMFFNYLCEAVELAAGVIESCKLFEHHGEVVTIENTRFLCEGSV